MDVYLINSYDIVNGEEFKKYGSLVLPLLQQYGAHVLVSDVNGVALEGKAKTMNAIIRFPSEQAVYTCYHDPAYQEIKKIRQGTTTNTSMVLVKSFEK
jgi:uncharacterized protein (DUF1330 family)